MLDNARARAVVTSWIDPIISLLVRLKVTPDFVTWAGTIGNCLIAYFLVAQGRFLMAAILLIVLSLTDLLDGSLARRLGVAGNWGAFLDSTLDRVSDASILVAITYYYSTQAGQGMLVIVSFAALVAGQLISYIRAKAESINVECKVGLAERAERSIIVLVGLTLTGLGLNALPIAMWLLLVVSVITVGQRIRHVFVQTKA